MPNATRFKRSGFAPALLLLLMTSMLRAQSPVASFITSSDSGCAPLQISFSNTSTGAAAYLWRFGNGNISSLANPNCIYTAAGNYTVTLVAISASGLRDSSSRVITILGNPSAGFSATSPTPCDDYNVYAFTNLSSGAVSYLWDFGDGSGSSQATPSHTYTSAGNYTVKLIATNIFGCQDIETRNAYISILPNPNASINVSQSSACDVNTVFQFSSPSAQISSWAWSFGDGNSSSLQNPSHQYAAPGAYQVSLIVTSAGGCSDTAQSLSQISIGTSLVPSFTINDSSGCAPLPVRFTHSVPNVSSLLWDFGDGNTSTLVNPTHTYTNPGTYSVTLTVTTQSGCNGSVTVPSLITADAKPLANFAVVQDSGCAPFTPLFINASTGATSYFWQFSNGQTSTAVTPNLTFSAGGQVDVTLTAISANGCRDSLRRIRLLRVFNPVASFSGFPLTGCPGMNVQFSFTGNIPLTSSYLWNFGDGSTSTQINPSHTYTALGNYTVSLIITNIFGCRDTVVQTGYVHVINGQIPFNGPDTVLVCLGDLLGFADPTTGSTSWSWDFGNGSGSTSQSPSVLYADTGTYIVTLQTAMPGGCSQTFNPYLVVRVIPYDPQPIYIGYLSSCRPYRVSFSTQTPDVTHYLWDFGDGSTSTLPNPTHTYAQAGTYDISLTLTIGEGCVTTLDTAITFGYSNPAIASVNDACTNTPILFSVNNLSAFTSATWLFGDGQSAAGFSTVHSYADSGTYEVRLITVDRMGCTDTFLLQPSVLISDPIPQFSLPPVICLYDTLRIQNQSSQANSFLWHFGDGNTSTGVNPRHRYASPGYYTIQLDATLNGCTESLSRDSAVLVTQPNAGFSYSAPGLCMPLLVSFYDQSSGAIQWSWHFGDGNSSAQQNPSHYYTDDFSDSLMLIVTDRYGCSDTSTQTPFPYYNAAASASQTAGCTPFTVAFSDQSNGAINWQWHFGDGSTSNVQNPNHTYTGDGTFDVMLIAGFPGGCTDTVRYYGMITASEPVADFYSPTVAGCSPTQISFVNTSSDAIQFNWDFGDGTNSTNVNPQHIYYIPGTYTVSLIVTNSLGCSDTLIRRDYIRIPGTYTYFNLPNLNGCQGSSISFVDSSVNASGWNWDFGDGILDSVRHPVHVYNDTGTYYISLITNDSIGCESSFTFPQPLRIHPVPVAMATVADTIGCNSFTTSFTNLSQGASSYQWWMGDGQTSNQANPVHTYIQSGLFYPELEATTLYGCKDTFRFPAAIHVLTTPIAEITASDTVACNPATLTFSSQNSTVRNPQYLWISGNGQSSTAPGFTVNYTRDTTYAVSLLITNDNGCIDTAAIEVRINPSPSAMFSTDTLRGCTPLRITFHAADTSALHYHWTFGQGQTSSAPHPVTVYDSAQVYQPSLVVSNSFGCLDSFTLSPGIEALLTPVAGFTSDKIQTCFNDTVQFLNQSSNLLQASWQWSIGTYQSTAENPTYAASGQGFIDASLIAINSNGCSDTLLRREYLEIFDTLPPSVSPIRSVSVLNDHDIEITWANGSERDIVLYHLWRFNATTGNWMLIHSDSLPGLAPATPLSSYIDTGLQTKDSTYTYRLETVDYCGYKATFSSLTAHTSVELDAQTQGMAIALQWTAYGGCTPGHYEIYRRERPAGIPVRIATLDGSTLQYTDSSLSCPYEYEYRIKAISLCALPFDAWSDTAAARPLNIFEGQKAEIVRTTVKDNRSILTEWLTPSVQPGRVMEYHILRSTDGSLFEHIGTTGAGTLSYNDQDADIHTQSYIYRIRVINDCGLSGEDANIGKSILLQAGRRERITTLTWSKYMDWDTGVDYYEIEYLNPYGQWEKIRQVNGQNTAVEIND